MSIEEDGITMSNRDKLSLCIYSWSTFLVLLFGLFSIALNGSVDELKTNCAIYKRRAANEASKAAELEQNYSAMKLDYDKLKAAHEALSDGLTASYAGDFLCTSYDLNCDVCQTTNITYSGEAPIPGYTVAADLSTFPIGTWLYIEGLGIRRVTDTGGGVGKNQLDVLVAGNHDDAKAWQGYGMHRVWILEGVE